MKRDIKALENTEFDLVVIGGGMFGACAAWDAVQRGLSVALVERHDFGGATSANSLKMVHGGIRYLQHADLVRMRQSSGERRALLRIAPHLVRPLPILIPTFGHGVRGKGFLRSGVAVFDLLTLDRNSGNPDPSRRIPSGRSLGRAEVLAEFPEIAVDGLTGGVLFSDGQVYNSPRLVFAFVQSAYRKGAVVANYVEVTGFDWQGTRISAVRATDRLTDCDILIRGKVVLNAAGPYAEHLLRHAAGLDLPHPRAYSRDVCFVVPRRLFKSDYALAVQGETRDPEARFGRGSRHLFVTPWRGYTLIGVWHKVYRGDPDSFTVGEREIRAFVNEVNRACPALALSLTDVAMWNAGLVPFGDNPEGAVHLRYGHRSSIIDHTVTHGVDNLVTLIGVRLTTGRYEAKRAVDLAFRKLGHRPPRSRTSTTALVGGDISDWNAYLRAAQREHGNAFTEDVIESLVSNYGSEYRDVLDCAKDRYDLAEPVGQSTTLRAQIVHALRHEMAQTVGDVVFRRTDLATGAFPGVPALRECATLVAAERSLSAATVRQQTEEVAARFPTWIASKSP